METKYENNYRWIIIALLFAATTINYFDRIVLSFLRPYIDKELQITDIQFGYILSAFQIMYMLGFLAAGKIIDKLGTKLGYLLSIFTWSFTAVMHAVCKTPICLGAWRGLLGLTESGNFPAAIKSVSEWFYVKDRAFATSIFNSGPHFASIVGPQIMAVLYLAMGWRFTFFSFGALGFLLVLIWIFLYKNPSYKTAVISKEKQNSTEQISWKKLLRIKETYGIMLGKFLTDPVWWFYLYWMPSYLESQRGFNIKANANALFLIYAIAMLLGILGGWLPKFFMKRGWEIAKARKTTMKIAAACLPLTAFAVFAKDAWLAIALVSLACGAHTAWSANIFTLASDCFPSKIVASITGLGGFAGGLGGLLLATLAPGFIITYFGYIPIFVLMGVLHPLAYLSIKFLIRNDKILGGI